MQPRAEVVEDGPSAQRFPRPKFVLRPTPNNKPQSIYGSFASQLQSSRQPLHIVDRICHTSFLELSESPTAAYAHRHVTSTFVFTASFLRIAKLHFIRIFFASNRFTGLVRSRNFYHVPSGLPALKRSAPQAAFHTQNTKAEMASRGSGGRGRGRGGNRGPLPRDVQVSKKMSRILRHAAAEEGLTLGPGGYVSVKDLVGDKPLLFSSALLFLENFNTNLLLDTLTESIPVGDPHAALDEGQLR